MDDEILLLLKIEQQYISASAYKIPRAALRSENGKPSETMSRIKTTDMVVAKIHDLQPRCSKVDFIRNNACFWQLTETLQCFPLNLSFEEDSSKLSLLGSSDSAEDTTDTCLFTSAFQIEDSSTVLFQVSKSRRRFSSFCLSNLGSCSASSDACLGTKIFCSNLSSRK